MSSVFSSYAIFSYFESENFDLNSGALSL